MSNEKDNPFVSFYGKYNISPVHQDITDIEVHLWRREKLYRKLGLPPIAFSDKTILEVGPGGGYNALAYFQWGANVDFVEPNPKAQEELPELLKNNGVKRDQWRLFKEKIEDYPSTIKYDIVIAEGFIPGLYNISEVVAKLSELVNNGGVVVVTCVDDISYFFEHVKRIIASHLILDVESFTDKVQILTQAFSTHLKTLKNASRSVEDWVTDQFLNPAIYANFFGIDDCLKLFGEEFEFLGSSPAIFTDSSWYKELDWESRDGLLEQFYQKRHILLLKDLPESARLVSENKKLYEAVYNLRRYVGGIEGHLISDNTEKIIDFLKKISIMTKEINSKIPEAIDEAISLLSDKNVNAEKVSQADKLAAAFGRGQQYVCMVKEYSYRV